MYSCVTKLIPLSTVSEMFVANISIIKLCPAAFDGLNGIMNNLLHKYVTKETCFVLHSCRLIFVSDIYVIKCIPTIRILTCNWSPDITFKAILL